MVWALAFLIGFFVCLLVELPFAGLYKEVFKTRCVKDRNKGMKLD